MESTWVVSWNKINITYKINSSRKEKLEEDSRASYVSDSTVLRKSSKWIELHRLVMKEFKWLSWPWYNYSDDTEKEEYLWFLFKQWVGTFCGSSNGRRSMDGTTCDLCSNNRQIIYTCNCKFTALDLSFESARW